MASKHVEKAIALPFSIDSFGRVASTTDQSKIWADRVRSVIGTTIGERVMRAGFGNKIAPLLFSGKEAVAEMLRREIDATFSTYLGTLTLSEVTVTKSDDTEITVDITYTLPNQTQEVTSVGFVVLNGTAPIYEEYR